LSWFWVLGISRVAAGGVLLNTACLTQAIIGTCLILGAWWSFWDIKKSLYGLGAGFALFHAFMFLVKGGKWCLVSNIHRSPLLGRRYVIACIPWGVPP